jgi:formylglycine-generating enzyme required for sulfatase activity
MKLQELQIKHNQKGPCPYSSRAGGSWFNSAYFARAGYRDNRDFPGFRYGGLGFRLVKKI